MSRPHQGFTGPPALVPAELRGYRRFRLTADGLLPTVHAAGGPWDGVLQRATCAEDGEHAAPAAGCGCGLYGWYAPGDAAASGYGDVTAVVAARGRTVLGDCGFRAAAARVEAVAVPPRRAAARRVLAERYPGTAVYSSRRRMLRDHPPADVSSLGIVARRSPMARYRPLAVAVWALGSLALTVVTLLSPRGDGPPDAATWLPALGGVLAWQALLIWLVTRAAGSVGAMGIGGAGGADGAGDPGPDPGDRDGGSAVRP